MNWEHVKADWDDVKGKVKSKWGKLTDDDIKLIGGKWDQLVGKLRHHYGYDKDHAERNAAPAITKPTKPKQTSFDLRDVQLMVMAAERMGISPIVRPPLCTKIGIPAADESAFMAFAIAGL